MIRDTDKGLYEEQTSNKKVQDMKNRCALINETEPDCVVPASTRTVITKNT